MKRFSQFLNEGRDAPLYHGTFASSFLSIVEKGAIEPRTFHNAKILLKNPIAGDPTVKIGTPNAYAKYFGGIIGVSMTRNLKFASEWASGIVLQFDQAALARNFEIIPTNYFNRPKSIPGRSFEFEEFVVTNKLINLQKYCTGISFYNSGHHTKASDWDSVDSLEAFLIQIDRHVVKTIFEKMQDHPLLIKGAR